MKYLNSFFSRRNILIIVIAAAIFSFIGYYNWNNQFKLTYYNQNTTLSGQLFQNVENTTVVSKKNPNPFSKVPYESVTIKIGSLASKYDNSTDADKANNIINSKVLNEKFVKWLVAAFDEKESKKITKHIEVYYNDQKVNGIGY